MSRLRSLRLCVSRILSFLIVFHFHFAPPLPPPPPWTQQLPATVSDLKFLEKNNKFKKKMISVEIESREQTGRPNGGGRSGRQKEKNEL